MASQGGRLYHCGARAPKRSTFADANRLRDARIFGDLFKAMLGTASPGFRRKLGDAVRLIDATGLHLAGVGAQWARFSTQVCGAKAHVVFDPDLGRPVYHALSAANVNDISAAKDMPIEAGATYVFDLGYYDFAWWARLDAQGCRLVTRFKKNTPLARARALPLDPRAGVVADRASLSPSWPGLTRPSRPGAGKWGEPSEASRSDPGWRSLDGRVKPGHDGRADGRNWPGHGAKRNTPLPLQRKRIHDAPEHGLRREWRQA